MNGPRHYPQQASTPFTIQGGAKQAQYEFENSTWTRVPGAERRVWTAVTAGGRAPGCSCTGHCAAIKCKTPSRWTEDLRSAWDVSPTALAGCSFCLLHFTPDGTVPLRNRATGNSGLVKHSNGDHLSRAR